MIQTLHAPGQDRFRPISMAMTALPLGLFLYFVSLVPASVAGKTTVVGFDWVPALGVHFSIHPDGLGLLFGLIITGVGAVVALYSSAYLAGHVHLGRFYGLLTAFMLSMLGLVFTDNLLVLFVFWELTTFISYLLIGFDHESDEARFNARQALLITGAGGLVLLVGILLLGMAGGSYEVSELVLKTGVVQASPLYGVILACILFGAFTKSAQFPFHFWLPNAMSAPTPISAYLHSATMVKAGIYLLARLHPVLGGTPAWMKTLVIVGGATALWGAILAMGQSDLKRILAYTTVMALGIMVMFLGGRTTPALTAAMTFVLVHSLYKSTLFLVAGIIDHQTGTRMVERIGGLCRAMPFTAFAVVTAALSMAGFPLFFGFIGKEIMYKGALTEDVYPGFATFAALLANALMVAVAGLLLLRPFFGRYLETPQTPVEASWRMWSGTVLLGFLCLFFGMVPDWVAHWLIEPSVKAFHPTQENIQLKLFYGINEPLLLSVLTLALGALLYRKRRALRGVLCGLPGGLPMSGNQVYRRTLQSLDAVAGWQTRVLQNGSLDRYLQVIVACFIVLVAGGLLRNSGWPEVILPPVSWLQGSVAAILMAAVGVVILAPSRLLAMCALGVIGASVALIFLICGAPDVALTQLMVETLTVIIASLVLLRLPGLTNAARPTGGKAVFNAFFALGSGLLVCLLLMAVTTGELPRPVTAFFEQNSVPAAHGRNIVNVILVDFRSLDTLGEIIVVATAGLAGVALIRSRRRDS